MFSGDIVNIMSNVWQKTSNVSYLDDNEAHLSFHLDTFIVRKHKWRKIRAVIVGIRKLRNYLPFFESFIKKCSTESLGRNLWWQTRIKKCFAAPLQFSQLPSRKYGFCHVTAGLQLYIRPPAPLAAGVLGMLQILRAKLKNLKVILVT